MRTTLVFFVIALAAGMLGLVPVAAPREAVERQLVLEHQYLGGKLDNVQAFTRYFNGVVDELQQAKTDLDEARRRVLEVSPRLHPRLLEMIEYREGVKGLAPEELVTRQLRWVLALRAEWRDTATAAAFNLTAPSLP